MNIIIKRFLITVIILFFITFIAMWFKDSYNIEKGQKYINLKQNSIADTMVVLDKINECVLTKHRNDTLIMNESQIIINYKLIK